MSDPSSKKRSRSAIRNAVEILTLWGFAVAQPIYDLLSRGVEFLFAHQLGPADIIALVAALSLLLPGLLVVAEGLVSAACRRWRFTRRYRLHGLVVALLIAMISLPALKQFPAGSAVAASLALGSFFAWAMHRWANVRSFVAMLSPTVVLFPALFLFRPSVSGVLFASHTQGNGTSGIASTTPIVFVLLDELPTSSLMAADRRIDAERYPAFADLADHSHWFRNATTVAEGTTYAVPAILTGRYPNRRRAAHVSEYPENLFTWLGDAYSMNVFESLTRLCPEHLRLSTGLEESLADRVRATSRDLGLVYLHRLLPDSLSDQLPAVTSTWRDFGGGQETPPNADTDVNAAEPQKRRGASSLVFERFIDSIRPTRRPVLHFLHVNLPHLPWKYLPSGKEYGPMDARQLPHGLRGERWQDDPWATIQGFQRHLLQLAYTDRLLGRLIERLRDVDLFDRSLIIVTADHGASFWPGGSRREVTEENRADILSVPLFVKAPFQSEGDVNERNVETIDILPTLADVLDSPLPWPIDGQSMLDDSLPARPDRVWIDAAGHEIVGRVVLAGSLDDDTGKTLKRKLSLFGSAEGPEALFRIGRYRDLIGREPAELPVAASTGLEVVLSDALIFENLNPGSSYVPARIVGSLGSAPGGRVWNLAVAVNGKIRAVTQTYTDPNGDWMFDAMVPEDSFLEGFNPIEVFAISEGESTLPRLAAIPRQKAIRFDLQLGPGGSPQQITASDGRSIRIVPQGLQGEVVFDGVSFAGWAADVEQARIADSILLFVGRQQISRVRTGGFRRDVAERYQERALAQAGFSFVVPYSAIDDPDSPDIRFFAILDNVATPLPYRDAWTRRQR